jgi:hypothetical protein
MKLSWSAPGAGAEDEGRRIVGYLACRWQTMRSAQKSGRKKTRTSRAFSKLPDEKDPD